MELTPSFLDLLCQFRSVFTNPSFALFVALLSGWTLSCRHRFITDASSPVAMSATATGVGFHRFFSHARWGLDTLCMLLARLLVKHFCPSGPIWLAGDDTLCRKRGLNLYGAGMAS